MHQLECQALPLTPWGSLPSAAGADPEGLGRQLSTFPAAGDLNTISFWTSRPSHGARGLWEFGEAGTEGPVMVSHFKHMSF